jgi:wyosine [tRNA(Phe)-imidazoG37] synthetase (radical SAM superfamily)
MGEGLQRQVDPAAGKQKQVELSPIHDCAGKFLQPELLPQIRDYVRWQAALRGSLDLGPEEGLPTIPQYAPVSINLDITTACNFACDHCVDMDILNTGIRYRHEQLLESLSLMADRGLRSVIVIGGGEPTVYPRFVETVRFLKERGLQVSVVSNGSGMDKIAAVADVLEEGDWIRLSLDSGSDPTFQAMHKPKKPISLDEICAGVPPIRALKPQFKIGFSFIITWRGANINDTHIVENIGEIVMAAERARQYEFDYIALKPFLTRAEQNNAEIVDLHERDAHFDDVMARIRVAVDEAKKLETDRFRVYETTNLKVLENRSFRDYTEQPRNCHMQFFRQVLSPLGMYNCPVYRNQPHGKVGEQDAYAGKPNFTTTLEGTAALIQSFDATTQCKEVTCLYNHVNWWLEDLIDHPEKLEALAAVDPEEPDFFF